MSKFANWGNYPKIHATEHRFTHDDSAKRIVEQAQVVIPRGMGRCYGDSALAPQLLSTLSFNQIESFDEKTGQITCQSGVTFEELLDIFVPRGWFLPVTPGTKFITVGGAIASDVHGKNHHKEGSFSNHVLHLDLLKSDGNIVRCSKKKNSELFWATCGGMGLTGLVLRATFTLRRIETAYIKQDAIRARNLDQIMDLFEESIDWTYSMAWIDCLSRGDKTGRSIMYRGEHATTDDLKYHDRRTRPLILPPKRKLNVPLTFPNLVLNPLTVKAFNFMYYHKQPSGMLRNIIDYDSFFYPLDSIHNWNRIYGSKGFTQYQFVLPKAESRQGLMKILGCIQAKNRGSFLAVLKLFGHQDDLISFPMEGYTLALDFPIRRGLFEFLDELDEMVLEHGGRLYLTKDVRMAPTMFQKGYPNAKKFVDIVKNVNPDAKYQSLQSQRIGITPMKTALILGATSDIGKALARKFAADGFQLVLTARDPKHLDPLVTDIKTRQEQAEIETMPFDALDFDSHAEFFEKLQPKPDVAVCVFGYLGDQATAQSDFSEAHKIVDSNYTGAVSILNRIADDFEQRKTGSIIGISSVAGDRGRAKNYIYGSAKAAFTAYLSGLRNRLTKSNVHVLTVKPGFVYTRMTEGLDLPPRLTARPERVADDIFNAYKKGRNEIYTKGLWRYMMLVIRHIPEFIFKKMDI